jgi:hypothetical protein
MSRTLRSPEGFSVFIEAYLLLGTQRVDAEQICDGMITLRRGPDIAPGSPAMLVIEIEGRKKERQIILPEGHRGGQHGAVRFF